MFRYALFLYPVVKAYRTSESPLIAASTICLALVSSDLAPPCARCEIRTNSAISARLFAGSCGTRIFRRALLPTAIKIVPEASQRICSRTMGLRTSANRYSFSPVVELRTKNPVDPIAPSNSSGTNATFSKDPATDDAMTFPRRSNMRAHDGASRPSSRELSSIVPIASSIFPSSIYVNASSGLRRGSAVPCDATQIFVSADEPSR
jgi:hypothetical protein